MFLWLRLYWQKVHTSTDVFDSKISDVVRGKHGTRMLSDDCPALSSSAASSTTNSVQHSQQSLVFPNLFLFAHELMHIFVLANAYCICTAYRTLHFHSVLWLSSLYRTFSGKYSQNLTTYLCTSTNVWYFGVLKCPWNFVSGRVRTRERDAENQKQTAEIFALSPHSALLQWHLYIEFMHGEWNCVLFYNAVPCITVIVLIL